MGRERERERQRARERERLAEIDIDRQIVVLCTCLLDSRIGRSRVSCLSQCPLNFSACVELSRCGMSPKPLKP